MAMFNEFAEEMERITNIINRAEGLVVAADVQIERIMIEHKVPESARYNIGLLIEARSEAASVLEDATKRLAAHITQMFAH